MDQAIARERLMLLTAADQDPVLDAWEVDSLLDAARRPDLAGNSPENVASVSAWASGTTVLVGAMVRTSSRFWRCVVPGTTAATAPAWPNLDGYRRSATQVVDGTVRWEDAGTTWAPTFDLDEAAAQGWRLKAGKAAGRFDFAEDGQQFTRSQVVAHCSAMADQFAASGAATVQT